MTVVNKINIAVIGATGYTGLDLVYMLSKHPKTMSGSIWPIICLAQTAAG